MSKKRLLLIGAGEFAEWLYEYFTSDSDYKVVGFTVDEVFISEPSLHGLPVVPWEEAERLFAPVKHQAFIAAAYTGLNRLRSRFYLEARSKGYQLASYISSHATVSPRAAVGDAALILEGSVLQPYCRIGNNVCLGMGSCVCHHSEIGDHNFLSAHVVVLGRARTADHCFFGANSTVFDHRVIGSNCIIGAGAAVNQDLPDNSLVKLGLCEVLPLEPDRAEHFA